MTMPIDFVLVRHGQSESNLAKSRSEQGKHDDFRRVREGRHTRSFRLTALGRQQAKRAGEWIAAEGGQFGRHITSEYVRAMETAALLNIPNAEWYRNVELTERAWGDLDRYDQEERARKFGEVLKMRDIEPFFWAPPNGESFLDLRVRIRTVLNTLHRDCSDKRVIVVCHGEVMWGFRVLLEYMSQQRFKELHLSTDPYDRLYNCEIHHYSRRNPHTDDLEDHVNWMRRIRPADDPVWSSGWQEIERRRYSNQELLEIVEEYPAVID